MVELGDEAWVGGVELDGFLIECACGFAVAGGVPGGDGEVVVGGGVGGAGIDGGLPDVDGVGVALGVVVVVAEGVERDGCSRGL